MIFGLHPLLLVTFFPLVGFAVLALIPGERKTALRWAALLSSLATFGISLAVLFLFLPVNNGQMQLRVDLPWVDLGGIQIRLQMGLDGLSILMVLLTTFLTPLAILSTWSAVKERVKGFMLFFLLLEVGMIGVFLALDLVLFYIFWEFTLIPMYFLIGMWGGERRIYAAVKFILFTMAGSVLMLLAILFIGLTAGTFSWEALAANRSAFESAGTWLFLAFGVAFAIKVPIFPLHTWLPDAHVEAPTAGSVILAGVLLKMGTYGFLRFNLPLFPEASVYFAPLVGVLAVIGILYGAAVSYVQKDAKKLVAYSSVSHLGFVMLGIFAMTAQSVSGSILQMVNHGLSTGGLFLVVGMIYERRHTRLLSAFGGLWKVAPVMGALALIITLSSAGLPGLNGFMGEFPILLGSFDPLTTAYHSSWYVVFASLGVILAAVYLLVMFEKIFLGPVTNEENLHLAEINGREIVTLLPILVVVFWIGLYPKFFFDLMNPTVENLLKVVRAAAGLP
jgi:NADH-quinone oxidoreductase subunit M